jgi:hypothetical protein
MIKSPFALLLVYQTDSTCEIEKASELHVRIINKIILGEIEKPNGNLFTMQKFSQ